MAYALSLSGLLTTFRHHFVQRPHAQCKCNCFNPTARACYVTFARQCNTTMYMRLCNGGVDAVRMRTLNKGMAARYQQENHVTRYPVILYRSVGSRRLNVHIWRLAN